MISTLVAMHCLLGQVTTPWAITSSGQLQFNGQKYVPFGVRVGTNSDEIKPSLDLGIKSFLVSLSGQSSRWKDVVTQLDAAGADYMLSFSELTPPCLGYSVEPENYRIQDITLKTDFDAEIPGCEKALYILVNSRDGTVVDHRMMTLDNGRIHMSIDPGNGLPHVALLYPMVTDLRFPDMWEGFDAYRDRIVGSLNSLPAMTGLRGIVNPIGSIPSFPDADQKFVPNSERFRIELLQDLKRKYVTPARCVMAWGISASDISDFSQLSRLVPLYSGSRGAAQLWDPVRDTFYRVAYRQSKAWEDISQVMQGTLRRRYRNILVMLQNKLNVPVFQDWGGWNGPYATETVGLSGLGVRMEGDSFSAMLAVGARAAKTIDRWQKPGVLIATDVQLANSNIAAREAALQDSASMGVRGWFVDASSESERTWVADFAKRAATDANFLGTKPHYLAFPEAATNPAYPMRLGGDLWWVPSPNEGIRLDFGPNLQGYQINGVDGKFTAIWSKGAEHKVLLRVDDPTLVRVAYADGRVPQVKVGRSTVELSIGPTPVLLSGMPTIPIPEEAAASVLAEFGRLEKLLPTGMQLRLEEVSTFKQAAAIYQKNPSQAFMAMRTQLDRLKKMIGPVLWIEGEACRVHNFSEIVSAIGASGGAALRLNSRLTPSNGIFSAKYPLTARVEGTNTIWVALAGSGASSLHVIVDGEIRQPANAGIGNYGDGYRWVSFGSLNLTNQVKDYELTVNAPLIGEVVVDAIVIMPENLTPNGLTFPWDPPKVSR